ncbi:MAG: hypothetical protein ACTS1Z_07310 [Parasphingopyxis sp.]|uniref:hypothetical protein n=1 Tax=Parasphingopyxis sp. TaxID=1920299 RepID=UPI003F9EEF88
MGYGIALGLASAVLASILSVIFSRFKSDWSARRTVLFSLLPPPLLVLAASIILLFDAHTASAEECGVDACAMMSYAVIVVTPVALAISVLAGLLGSFLAVLYLKKT